MLNKIFSATASIVGFSILVVACAEDKDEPRPPTIEVGSPGGGVPIRGGSDGGAGGGAAVDEVLTGSLAQYTDDSFSTTMAYSAPSTVFVIDEDGKGSVDGEFDGAELVVEGVALTDDRWVLAKPINDDTMYPTVNQLDLSGGRVEVSLVPLAVIDEILTVLADPTERDDDRAQVLMRIVDSTGAGVQDVRVGSLTATTTSSPAFASDGIWLDKDDSTNAEGLIFFANLEAPELPGQETLIILEGVIEAEVAVRIVRGAITVVTVVVP